LYCIFKLISSSNIMEAKNNCICIFIFPEEISVNFFFKHHGS
jgi:hypothetical protein